MRQVHYGSLLLLHSAQLLEKHLDLHVRGKSWPAWRSCRHLWPHQQIIWWIGLERHQNKKRDGNSMEALKALASMTQVFGITNSRGGSCRALPPAKHRIHAKHSSHLASCWLLNWKTLRLRHWHPLLSQHWVNTHNQKKTKSLLFDTVRLDQAPPGPEMFKTKHIQHPKWNSLWCFSRVCFDFTRRTATCNGKQFCSHLNILYKTNEKLALWGYVDSTGWGQGKHRYECRQWVDEPLGWWLGEFQKQALFTETSQDKLLDTKSRFSKI